MKNSRILVYSIYSPPELIGIAKYTGEMCHYLNDNGFNVELITSAPYYPHWRVFKGYSNRKYTVENLDGVVYKRCPYWMPGKISGLSKILHLVSFALFSYPSAIKSFFTFKPQVVFITYPYLFTAPFVIIWLKLTRSKCKLWLHIQDFELDAALGLDLINSSVISKFGYSIEKWIFRNSNVVSTISEKMVDKLRLKEVVEEKLYLFPNWIDTARIYPLPRSKNELAIELDIQGNRKIALYSGNIGEKQGIEIIISAAKLLKHTNIDFYIFGEGSNREKLIELAYELKNVKFYDLQPTERLNELLNLADVHLLPQLADAADLVMPSKLLGMLATGKPIVATAPIGSELYNVVTNTGIVVAPGDEEGIAHAIEKLVTDNLANGTLGQNAIQIVKEKWEKTTILSMLQSKINKVSEKHL